MNSLIVKHKMYFLGSLACHVRSSGQLSKSYRHHTTPAAGCPPTCHYHALTPTLEESLKTVPIQLIQVVLQRASGGGRRAASGGQRAAGGGRRAAGGSSCTSLPGMPAATLPSLPHASHNTIMFAAHTQDLLNLFVLKSMVAAVWPAAAGPP